MQLTTAIQVVGRTIAFYPALAKVFGIVDSVFLCQLIYWHGKSSHPDGWIYKTSEEWEDETTLNYRQQYNIRKKLLKQGLIEEHYDRTNHRMYFRPNIDQINKAFAEQDQRKIHHLRAKMDEAGAVTEEGRHLPNLQVPPSESTSGTCRNGRSSIHKITHKITHKKSESGKRSSPRARVVNFSKEDLEMATLLRDLIKENTPTFKEPDLEAWANHVRLMRERDRRTEKQIDFVIRWSQKNSFWRANILSTSKLRDKFDQLVAQIARERDEKTAISNKHKVAFT